ncbi:hypothetical protein ACSLOS_31050, partial [Klebsiella pneumoniae]
RELQEAGPSGPDEAPRVGIEPMNADVTDAAYRLARLFDQPGAMAGDILLDFGSCRSMPFACRHPGISILTMYPLQHQAAGGGRIGHIAASRLLQYGDERRRHRLVVSQQGIDGNGPDLAVALQDA